jgi:hypothetical protein
MIDPSAIRRRLSGPLLRNVGTGAGNGRDVFVASLEDWRDFTAQATAGEFGLDSPGRASRLPEFTWIDESFGSGSTSAQHRPAVAELYGLALRGLRDVAESPWIRVGRSDYSAVVKRLLRHAIRMALAEDPRPSRELWERVLDAYGQGRWPIGVARDSRLGVL